MSLSPVLRSRLEIRGVTCSNDPEFITLVPWIRFTPAICASMMGIATALAFTPLLWVMVSIAAMGAIFPRHPFDFVYNHGVRYLTKTQPPPMNAAPTRFACGLASVWLVATAVAFTLGPAWLGYTLGGALTSVATLVSITHFCIPSNVYQFVFGDRSAASAALVGELRGERA